MSQRISDVIGPHYDVVALGEANHLEPAFGWVRNRLFAQLVEQGFGSIVLESDRVAALTVDDYVRGASGTLDSAMENGFSHGMGQFPANRALVAWMRQYNAELPPPQRLSFHGCDAPCELPGAPSPRRFLEPVRDYLGVKVELDALVGDDESWSRDEATMDARQSPGATPEAGKLRLIADDLLAALYERAVELIAASSLAAWRAAETRAKAALGLLRYHQQAAQRIDDTVRWSRMSATRDAIMARNLLDIRQFENHRGPTLLFAHNRHLQQHPATLRLGEMNLEWPCAGEIAAKAVLGDRYAFIAGSLGVSDVLPLDTPEPGTFEAELQDRIVDWALTTTLPPRTARVRTISDPRHIPLDRSTLDGASAIMHIADGPAVNAALRA